MNKDQGESGVLRLIISWTFEGLNYDIFNCDFDVIDVLMFYLLL